MKTQSRTTKALQSLSLFKIKGREKQQKKTWAQDWSIFSSEQKSNKLGRNREKDKRWPSVGLLPTLGQDGTLGSQTTQQGLSLRVSNSGDKQELREAATCLLRPRGPGRGSPEVLEFGDSQAFCAHFNTFSISLAVFQTLGFFFLSPKNVIKLRGQRPLTGEGFQRPPLAAATACSGRGGF